MILKGSQRGGARQLARHLLNRQDNDHVELHAVQGFMAEDLAGALAETHAISRATKCRQFMFSLSLSPPKDAQATIADFEAAIELAAEKLGLAGQPRVIVFHEKQARRHAHVVFSRIDSEALKAINLPFWKERLSELSRELFLTHGWALPKGLSDPALADPLNFGLEEWQVAKRAKRDPRELKAAFKQCWSRSDSRAAFVAALRERGFWLCRGDRRGFVAQDYQGNLYSLSRWLDVPSKELKSRLGSPEQQPSVAEAKEKIAKTLTATATRIMADVAQREAQAAQPLLARKRELTERHRHEREKLEKSQRARFEQEALARAARLRRGLRGMWDWITGRRRKSLQAMVVETQATEQRDRAERDLLSQQQRKDVRPLQARIERHQQHYERQWQAARSLAPAAGYQHLPTQPKLGPLPRVDLQRDELDVGLEL